MRNWLSQNQILLLSSQVCVIFVLYSYNQYSGNEIELLCAPVRYFFSLTVSGAMLDVHKTDDFNVADVDGAIKEWLKHAPKRYEKNCGKTKTAKKI